MDLKPEQRLLVPLGVAVGFLLVLGILVLIGLLT